MPIKIKEAPERAPLCELAHTHKSSLPIDLVRMMVGNLSMGHDANGIVWQGMIWDCIDDGFNELNYPGVGIDIRVYNGCYCEVTTDGVYGPGLISQWVKEQVELPHIRMIGKNVRPTGTLFSVG